MKEFAKKYLAWYNKQSKVVKALLCLLYDIPATLYRVADSAEKEDTLGIVLAIVLGVFGGFVLFIIDLVTQLVMDKLYWLKDFGVNNLTKSVDKEVNDAKTETSDSTATESTKQAVTTSETTEETTDNATEEVEEEPAEEATDDAKDGEVSD